MVQFKKWQLYLVILFSFFAIIFSLPNFFSKETLKKFPTFIPSEQIVFVLYYASLTTNLKKENFSTILCYNSVTKIWG